MTMTSMIPMLETDDIYETVAFYTEKLSFCVGGTYYSDKNELTWVMLDWDRASIMFSTRFEATKGIACHMTGSLYFFPQNINDLWEQLKDVVQVEWPLQTLHYGMTEFAIIDNNGYRLIFGQ